MTASLFHEVEHHNGFVFRCTVKILDFNQSGYYYRTREMFLSALWGHTREPMAERL